MSAISGIRKGLNQVQGGQGEDAAEVFDRTHKDDA